MTTQKNDDDITVDLSALDLSVFDDMVGAPTAPADPADLVGTTRQQINQAFGVLADRREGQRSALVSLALARDAFDDCKHDMILGGHVTGKNEAERDARLSDLLRVQTEQLRTATRRELFTKTDLDIAQDNVRRLDMLTRLNN